MFQQLNPEAKTRKWILLPLLPLLLFFGHLLINGLLVYEAAQGDIAGIRTSLFLGADINTIDNNRTPLECTIEAQRNETAKMLISRGANVNLGNVENGDTPLMAAAYYGQDDIVENLLKEGANVNSRNQSGKSALWWTQEGKKDGYGTTTLALLKQAGAEE